MRAEIQDVPVIQKARKQRITLPIFCFLLLYAIYLSKRIYIINNSSTVLKMLDFMEWPIYGVIFVKTILNEKYKVRELLLIIGTCIIFFMNFCMTGYAELLKGTLLVVALRKTDHRELFKCMYYVLVISIAFTVLLYLLGLSDAGIQRRGATALGYTQANSVGFVLMMMTFLAIAKKSQITQRQTLVLFLLNVIGFILSNSRTSFSNHFC